MERSDRNLNPYFNNPTNVNMANNWPLNRGWPLKGTRSAGAHAH